MTHQPPITLTNHDAADLAELPHELRQGLEAAAALADAGVAASTQAAYVRAFARFATWAEGQGLGSLPASRAAVAAYLGLLHRRRLTPSRIGVVLAAIAWHHRRAGLADPTSDQRITLAMRGARRLDATRPKRQAHALLAKDPGGLPGELHRLVDAIAGDDLPALRDRTLILLGFAGAFRRSELAALTLADLAWTARGLYVTVRRSKSDQEGRGKRKAIVPGRLHCPVATLRSWLDALERATGRERLAGEGRGRLPVFVGFARPAYH